MTAALIHSAPVGLDQSWGLDHGTWAVLAHMFPAADIPVYQLSVNYNLNGETHFGIGRELKSLRDQGVLITDHYWPLLYALGAAEPSETVTVFNDRCVFGSVSMISLIFGA